MSESQLRQTLSDQMSLNENSAWEIISAQRETIRALRANQLSDADRAVLDAALQQERLHASYPEPWPCDCDICAAVRARRETQP